MHSVGKRFWLGALIILAAAAFLLFFHLGTEPFQDFDESTYAEISHEALVQGDSFHLSYNSTPYLRKPPLGFWLMEVSQQVIPDVEFADRVPSALAALLLIAVVMLLTYEAAGESAALLAGAVLATTSSFIEAARQARFDTLVTLFLMLATYAALRARADARFLMAFGIFLGLGILAKGVIVLFALVPLLVIFLVERKWEWCKNTYAWLGVLMLLLIALPWHIMQTLSYGGAFWHEYVGNQVVARIGGVLFGDTLTNAGYVSYLFLFAAPWIFALIVALFMSARFWKGFSEGERRLLLCSYLTLTALALVLATTKTKAVTYLIPLYPFMAIIVGIVGTYAYRLYHGRMRIRYIGALALAIFIGTVLSVFNGLHLNQDWYGVQIARAQEEYAIAQIIRLHPRDTIYAYDTDALGSIKFYTQRLTIYDVLNPSALMGTTTDLVVTPSTLLSHVPGTTLFHGTQISLVRFSSVTGH